MKTNMRQLIAITAGMSALAQTQFDVDVPLERPIPPPKGSKPQGRIKQGKVYKPNGAREVSRRQRQLYGNPPSK